MERRTTLGLGPWSKVGSPVLRVQEVFTEVPKGRRYMKVVPGRRVGDHMVLRAENSTVPNAVAALLLRLRDTTGKTPNRHFGWTEGNPIAYVVRFVLFGEGDTAPVTHEVLREAEPILERRPMVHGGGR